MQAWPNRKRDRAVAKSPTLLALVVADVFQAPDFLFGSCVDLPDLVSFAGIVLTLLLLLSCGGKAAAIKSLEEFLMAVRVVVVVAVVVLIAMVFCPNVPMDETSLSLSSSSSSESEFSPTNPCE